MFAGLCALGAAGLTAAFYMTRMLAMTFFGSPRWTEEQHPHESPVVMTAPMLVLSVGALFGGLFFVYVAPIGEWLARWLASRNPPGHWEIPSRCSA